MKKIIISLLVTTVPFLGAVITPKIIDSKIDTKIDLKKVELNKKGIELSILDKSGYLSTTRRFTLKIDDTNKLMSYLNNIGKNNLLLSQILKNKELFNYFFNGLVFEGVLKNSNIGTTFPEMKLTLVDSPKLNDFKSDDGLYLLEDIIENKKLSFNIVFSKLGKLKSITLDDISTNDAKTFNNLSVSLKDIIVYQKNNINILSSLGYMVVNLKHNGFITTFNLKDIIVKSLITKSKDINTEYSLNNLDLLTINNGELDLSIKASNVLVKNNLSFSNFVTHTTKTTADSIVIDSVIPDNDLLVSNLNFDTNISKLDPKVVNTLLKTSQDFNSNKTPEEKDIIVADSINKLIQSGLTFNSSLSFEDFVTSNLIFKNSSLETKNVLLKNKGSGYNLLTLMGSFKSDSTIRLTKVDAQSLLSSYPGLKPYLDKGILDKDIVIYKISIDKGAILLNGKPLL